MFSTFKFEKNEPYNPNIRFNAAERKFFELTQRLASSETIGMRHSELENIITLEGRELLRRLLEEHIELRGLGDVGKSILGSDGVKRTHKRIRKRLLISVFGEISVERMGYGSPGEQSLFPKDASLNLPHESYSHGIRKLIAREISKNSFDEALESVKLITGVSIPKGAAERLVRKAAEDFDRFYQEQCSPQSVEKAEQSPLIILTTDGKGVVMRREDLREATRKKAEKSKHKLNKRKSRGEKANSKRMATVASVYNINTFIRTPEQFVDELFSQGAEQNIRPRPVAKRVWARLEKRPENVIENIFEEALLRDPNLKRKWVCLVDGDPHQLRRIRSEAKKRHIDLTIVMDIIHVIEYLWKAARVFCEETSSSAEKWVTKRLYAILQGRASHVAAGMRRSATLKKLSEEARKPVDKCAGYLLKYTAYLRYNHYLREGFPIATGVIEGACRHLIKDRMDVTGARWSLGGAEAVIKLRSLRTSGDFESYWSFHEDQEYFRNHQSQYADPTAIEDHFP
jgi:hypothetical protein